jgi:hypothetical protein
MSQSVISSYSHDLRVIIVCPDCQLMSQGPLVQSCLNPSTESVSTSSAQIANLYLKDLSESCLSVLPQIPRRYRVSRRPPAISFLLRVFPCPPLDIFPIFRHYIPLDAALVILDESQKGILYPAETIPARIVLLDWNLPQDRCQPLRIDDLRDCDPHDYALRRGDMLGVVGDVQVPL